MLVARRIQALRLLDKGWTITQAAEATGTYRREVRRVANRFLEGGIERALSEEAWRRRAKLLESAQTAALIAMVCGPPPAGRARWTIALIADEAERRKVARLVSRETSRRTFADQDIKPWRENVERIEAGARRRGRPGVSRKNASTLDLGELTAKGLEPRRGVLERSSVERRGAALPPRLCELPPVLLQVAAHFLLPSCGERRSKVDPNPPERKPVPARETTSCCMPRRG